MSHATILVVEDETIVAKDIQSTLAHLGYRAPATATSGEDALRKASEIRPDLVLTDIVLKGSADFDRIELSGQEVERMKPARTLTRVNNAIPMRIVPTRRADGQRCFSRC